MWEWDGSNWTQYNPTTSPPVGCMTYDAARGNNFVFVGGLFNVGTWTYTPTDLTASAHVVSVATGGNVRLDLDAGSTHASKDYLVLGCIDGSGPRGITSGKITLLLSIDDYFLFTLMYPNTLISKSLGVLDTSGTAMAGIQVPKGLPTGLIGARFYHAYIVFKTSINYASTPVPLTFGP